MIFNKDFNSIKYVTNKINHIDTIDKIIFISSDTSSIASALDLALIATFKQVIPTLVMYDTI